MDHTLHEAHINYAHTHVHEHTANHIPHISLMSIYRYTHTGHILIRICIHTQCRHIYHAHVYNICIRVRMHTQRIHIYHLQRYMHSYTIHAHIPCTCIHHMYTHTTVFTHIASTKTTPHAHDTIRMYIHHTNSTQDASDSRTGRNTSIEPVFRDVLYNDAYISGCAR